jgi:membrane-associated phospholipid phosphatase
MLFGFAASGQAQVKTWHNISEVGGPILWAAGLGSSFFQDGSLGLDHAARTLDGMIASGGVGELLKLAVRERRPYGTTLDSFPSDHATLSFAVAAAQSNYHPKQAPFWYAAAGLIGYARVAGHDHFVQDVVVGAGLGYAGGQLSVSSLHGWIVAPLVENRHAGLMVNFSKRF